MDVSVFEPTSHHKAISLLTSTIDLTAYIVSCIQCGFDIHWIHEILNAKVVNVWESSVRIIVNRNSRQTSRLSRTYR